MRQRGCLELVKDHDCTILYHPDKANVVADALSRRLGSQLVFLMSDKDQLIKYFEKIKIVCCCFCESNYSSDSYFDDSNKS